MNEIPYIDSHQHFWKFDPVRTVGLTMKCRLYKKIFIRLTWSFC